MFWKSDSVPLTGIMIQLNKDSTYIPKIGIPNSKYVCDFNRQILFWNTKGGFLLSRQTSVT